MIHILEDHNKKVPNSKLNTRQKKRAKTRRRKKTAEKNAPAAVVPDLRLPYTKGLLK